MLLLMLLHDSAVMNRMACREPRPHGRGGRGAACTDGRDGMDAPGVGLIECEGGSRDARSAVAATGIEGAPVVGVELLPVICHEPSV